MNRITEGSYVIRCIYADHASLKNLQVYECRLIKVMKIIT
jgi:hypothetical protein